MNCVALLLIVLINRTIYKLEEEKKLAIQICGKVTEPKVTINMSELSQELQKLYLCSVLNKTLSKSMESIDSFEFDSNNKEEQSRLELPIPQLCTMPFTTRFHRFQHGGPNLSWRKS